MKQGYFIGFALCGMLGMGMHASAVSPLASGSVRALNPVSPPGLYITDPEVRQIDINNAEYITRITPLSA